MQGVVQRAHGALQDALGLGGRAPQHRELLVQEPPLQPLLLCLLGGRERQLETPRRGGWLRPCPTPRGWGPLRTGQTAQWGEEEQAR